MKLKIPNVTEITVSGEYIKLDQFLKFAGIAQTGGEAKLLVADGAVRVGGESVTARGHKLRNGAIVRAGGRTYRVKTACPPDENHTMR